jgi:hypothetical protein
VSKYCIHGVFCVFYCVCWLIFLHFTSHRETLDCFDFDVFQYSTEDLFDILTYMFNILNLLDEFSVSKDVFRAFLGAVSGRYNDKCSYHNFKHGAGE